MKEKIIALTIQLINNILHNNHLFTNYKPYYVKMNNDSDIAGSTDYICRYTSAASCENVFATQFHPEKSQIAGLTLLKNFLNWNGNT